MPKILTKRRMIDALCVLAIIAIVAYWFTSPYFAVQSLKAAIVNADEQVLGEMIDFPTLRQSFKDQITSGLVRLSIEEAEDPSALAGAAMTGLLAEKLIDAYVTPSGLARLTSNVEVPDNVNLPFSALFGSVGTSILNQEDFVIDRGLRSFSLRIQTKNKFEDEIEVIFEGNGLKWILVNVILPLNSSE